MGREWRWGVSAWFYRFSYLEVAHQVDDDLFAYLGDRLAGAVVADCGCGPGIVAAKLLARGARCVVAIDGNAAMLRQARRRAQAAVAEGRVIPVQQVVRPGLLPTLLPTHPTGRGFDLVLFKRSLYMPPAAAGTVLRDAVACLAPGGVVAVIHPAASLRRYAWGAGWRPRAYTPFHLLNRVASRLGEALGAGPYTLYRRDELLALASAAADGRPVALVPTAQRAYNVVAVHEATGLPRSGLRR